MKITTRLLFTFGLVVFLAAFNLVALTFNYQARMMPLIIGVPVLLLAITQLVMEIRKATGAVTAEPKAAPKETTEETAARPGRRRLATTYGWVLAMMGLIYFLGFIITTFLYPLLYMKIVGGRSWKLSAGISLGALVFLYVVMINGLNVDLYDGIVITTLRKSFAGY